MFDFSDHKNADQTFIYSGEPDILYLVRKVCLSDFFLNIKVIVDETESGRSVMGLKLYGFNLNDCFNQLKCGEPDMLYLDGKVCLSEFFLNFKVIVGETESERSLMGLKFGALI